MAMAVVAAKSQKSERSNDTSLHGTMFELDLEEIDKVDPEMSLQTPASGTSEKSKIAFFALQRAIERLRAFYYVLQVALGTLMAGICLAVFTEILWRLIPAGRTVEIVISGFSALGWFLTSATVAIMSTCPIDELDFNSFVHARPLLCIFLAVLPLTTAATRVWEMPLPRWISCGVSVTMFVNGCIYCMPSCFRCRRYMPSFGVLMEIWYLDVIVASTINEIALAEQGLATNIWLAFHASMALALQFWLWWKRVRSTLRFYISSYMAITWNSSYYACRAIDLSLGDKEWEEGRQLDVAIGASLVFAVLVLIPLMAVSMIGRKRLFNRLAQWVDRSRRLQDGAFMAMLLDSYLVEVDQPWWLSEFEAASSRDAASWVPKTKKALQRSKSKAEKADSVTKSFSIPNDQARPGFVKGHVTQVSADGKSFWVEIPSSRTANASASPSAKVFEVHRNQQVLPWPELLEQGRKRLRCATHLKQNLLTC